MNGYLFAFRLSSTISLSSAIAIMTMIQVDMWLFLAKPWVCLQFVIVVFPDHTHLLFCKYDIGLKTLLQQGISEPICLFYGDLVNKFKRSVGKPNFKDQLKKITKRYKKVGYNLDIIQQSACLVVSPITVYSYGFLFKCTTMGHASDSTTALT